MFARTLLIWCALAASASAQTIGGLSTLPVLVEGRYPVSGLDVPQGSIDELSKWAQKLVVEANGPDGSSPAIEVDIGLVKRAPVVYFAGDKPGLYVLCLIDTGSKSPRIVTRRVQVGEVVPPAPNPPPPGPAPVPTPVPPVPSPTRKAVRATYVFEKSREIAPRGVSAALNEIAGASGAACSAVDQDVKNGDGATPKQYEVAIREAKSIGLPCLVVEFDDGTFRAVKVVTGDDVKKAVQP